MFESPLLKNLVSNETLWNLKSKAWGNALDFRFQRIGNAVLFWITKLVRSERYHCILKYSTGLNYAWYKNNYNSINMHHEIYTVVLYT